MLPKIVYLTRADTYLASKPVRGGTFYFSQNFILYCLEEACKKKNLYTVSFLVLCMFVKKNENLIHAIYKM